MTDTHTALLSLEFKALSASLDLNPRSIQRAGRNTLIKDGHTMCQCLGTKLAKAFTKDIYVAADHSTAVCEAMVKTGNRS